MEITTKDYSVKYDEETATVDCQGIMRLNDREYEPIIQLLNQVVESTELPQITLNLRELKTLNSSGVTMLGMLVYTVDEKKTVQLTMQCSKQIAWQRRTIEDFQLLMSELQIEWV